jgi:hypothetical protein
MSSVATTPAAPDDPAQEQDASPYARAAPVTEQEPAEWTAGGALPPAQTAPGRRSGHPGSGRRPRMRGRVAAGLLYLVLLGAAAYGGTVYQGTIDRHLHDLYYPPQTSSLGSVSSGSATAP